jgi:hypothetical protein
MVDLPWVEGEEPEVLIGISGVVSDRGQLNQMLQALPAHSLRGFRFF